MSEEEVVFEEGLRRVDEKIKADIQREGWAAIGVHGEDGCPSFMYTVGLTEFGHPEILVSGLPHVAAYQILKGFVDRVRDGERFYAGQLVDEVFEDPYVGKLIEVPKPSHPLNAARRFYQDEVDALQLLWPDTKHVFPDENGWTHELLQRVADGEEW